MLFNRKVFQKLPADFMKRPIYKKMLEETIGIFNKMIVINKNGTHWILNEKQGEWDNGIWYSNTTYKKVKYYYGQGYDNFGWNRKKGSSKYPKVYDYDDWDEYAYGGYGQYGYSNYGNGYAPSTNGVVETPGDKKDNNK